MEFKRFIPVKDEKVHFSIDVIENKLSEKYSQELDEKLTNIVILSENDFINSIRKRVRNYFESKFKIAIENIKEITLTIKKKEQDIINKYQEINKFISDYLIQSKISNTELFITEFKKHCYMTGDYAIHQCEGKMLPIFENDVIKYVLCESCKKLYTPNLILLYCYFCSCNYFSNMMSIKRSENLLPATWKDLHCGGSLFNEKMRCIKCKDVFYLNIDENVLYCKNCKFSIDPMGIIWQCVRCHQDYKSPAKVFNNLEYEIIKNFIKETLKIKQKAKPLLIPCCKIGVYDLIFLHKKSCDGEIFQGELNKNIMILCEKCKMIYHYEKFTWTCPNCFKRFRKSFNKMNPIPSSKKRSFMKIKSCQERKLTVNEIQISPDPKKNNRNKIIQNNYWSDSHDCIDKKHSKTNLNIIELDLQASKDEMMDKDDIEDENCSLANQEEVFKQELKIKQNVELLKKLVNFCLDDYKLLQTIGEGSYGIIYLVAENKTSKKYAMKKIIVNNEIQLITFTNEYEIVHQIQHGNILKIKGLSHKKLDETTNVLYILMELAKTDWEKEIKHRAMNKNNYTEEELINVIKQLIDALSYLQEKNIAHRDIKPQNVLIFENRLYKLADFGEAKEVKLLAQKHNGTLKGTELYMAPALFNSLDQEKAVEHNPYKSDVYSLGYCTLLAATLSFNILYEIRKQTEKKMVHAIINKYLSDKYSPKFITLICRMVEYNEKFRFDFIQLKAFLEKNIS